MIIILSGHFQGCRSTPTTLDSSLLLGDKPSTQRHTSKLLCKYGTQERNVDTMSTLAQIIAIPWIFLFISFSLRALATGHLSWTSLCLLQQQRAKLSPCQQQTGGAHVSPGVTWSVETATGLRGVTPPAECLGSSRCRRGNSSSLVLPFLANRRAPSLMID
jgi:hypothetical protein